MVREVRRPVFFAGRTAVLRDSDVRLAPLFLFVNARLRTPNPVSTRARPCNTDFALAQCGSCWTFATSETVESRLFMKEGILADLSEQQVASCSPNPQDCGGTGGCEGGTAEIGFAGIMKSSIGGLASEWTYPYTSYSGTDSKCALDSQTPVAKVTDYTKVAANSYSAVMAAVQDGPIAISVAAMSWSSYESGVFDGCNQTNPDIDHAVQLVGYGTDSSAGDYCECSSLCAQDLLTCSSAQSPCFG